MATEQLINSTPKIIQAGVYTYTIDFDREAAYDYAYLGVTLFRSKRIKLDPLQSDTEVPQTLLHEILHALGGAYEISDWSHHSLDDKEKVKDKIDLMASALLQLLRTNKELVEWLQKT